jgi:glycosyltransferase involved in cell wall biosynthesis
MSRTIHHSPFTIHHFPQIPMSSPPLHLIYLIGTYPGLTTTFIDREVAALARLGAAPKLFSIRQPWTTLGAEQEVLRRKVTYLLPVRWGKLLKGHVRYLLTRPRTYFTLFFTLLLAAHPSLTARCKTLLHFGLGVYAAACIRDEPHTHLHAHFIDRAATVALVAAALLDIPYSVTAHANDIYVNPVLLDQKLSGAKFVATCTGYNHRHLTALERGRYQAKIRCIFHGLDATPYQRDPTRTAPKPIILAVGQLKEKKGLTYLVQACRQLKDQGFSFVCHIIGDGPLREALTAQIQQLGLEDTVQLCGALPHEQVIGAYHAAAIFTLPAVVASDGDRDGIPNVILEAMTMELPVVSTNHSGIPEVISDSVNGLLVPPGDVPALTTALAQLLQQPAWREQLGHAARQTVLEQFDLTPNVRKLLAEFRA